MKCDQSCPGFELVSPCPFPTITITPRAPPTVFIKLTLILPWKRISDPNKLNLDSSLKWTIFYCSFVHRICSVPKLRGTVWFFFDIKGLQHGIQATNFSLFDLRETVFLEIGLLVCSQNSREIDVAVSKQSFKDILTIIWSSSMVVIRGLLVLGFGSNVLSALNLFIKR